MSMKKLIRPVVTQITPYTPGKPIEEVKRELGIKDVFKMASNENALGPSPRALAAMKRAIKDVHRYPDGSCFYLKRALARKYDLSPEQCIIGNGSDELIVLALRTFINPGDEVIIASPTFLVYRLAAILADAKVITVPLRAFRYDLVAMRERVGPKTKMVFIANPDNPTGTYVTREEVEWFIYSLPKHVIVFFDEAYCEYVRAKDYPDTLKYLGRGNSIVSRTFSKVYGLAGLRIGWAAATREVAGYLNQLREPFNVNLVAQKAAEAALGDRAHVLRTRAMNEAGLRYLSHGLREDGVFYVPSVTNFLLINVGPQSQQLYQRLMAKGVIVREMSGWGLKNFIRVTIGTMRENQCFLKQFRLARAALAKGA